MADLTTTVGSLTLRTPVIAASGTFGYGLEYDGLVDWSLVGAVVVKGLSLRPSAGHPSPRIVETAAGVLNGIGLQNIGIDEFCERKLPSLRRLGVPVVANCWGDSPREYAAVAERLAALDGVCAVELNLSSPNRNEWGRLPAASGELTAAVVAAARRCCGKPLWVKLSPNVSDVVEIARAAAAEGADAVSLVNTLQGMAVDLEARRPALSNVSGGLSGPAIKPVALWKAYQLCRQLELPVVAGGGVWSGRDAVEFLMVGARAVQLGTANLYDPSALSRIAGETADTLDELAFESAREAIGSLLTY